MLLRVFLSVVILSCSFFVSANSSHTKVLDEALSVIHSDKIKTRKLLDRAHMLLRGKTDDEGWSRLHALEAYLALLDRNIEFGYKQVRLAHSYAVKSGNKELLAEAFRRESTLLKEMGYFNDALDLAKKSLDIVTELNSKTLLIENLQSMGNLYQNLQEHEKTLEVAHRLRLESIEQQNFSRLASASVQLGSSYISLNQYEQAQQYLEEGLQTSLQINFPYTGTIYFYLANIEVEKGNFEKAFELLETQVQSDKKYGVVLGISAGYMLRAKIYQKLGNDTARLSMLEQGYEKAEFYNDLDVKSGAANELSQVYELAGNYKKALFYEKAFRSIEKQLFDQKQAQMLAFNQVRLDVAGKDQQLKVANTKREDAEQFSFIQSFVMAVVAALAFFLGFSLLRNSRQKNDLEKYAVKLNQATEAKSLFLARMSHEIRTPINAIVGLTKLSQSQRNEDDRQENLKQILDSSDTLLGVINDILDFSKIEAGKLHIEKTSFHLDDVVKRSINQNNLRAHEKGLEIIQYIAPDVPNCLIGDPLRIQQILNNLLSNAVKFTSKGTVSIVISKAFSEKGLELEFMVRDSGIGLTEQEQLKLFSSFTQADESTTREYGGTGLGLSICRQLVELMGGRIWVKSKKGEGAAFHFNLLLSEDTSAAAHEISDIPDLENLRVLVADDMVLSRQMICDSLRSLGIQADQAHDGKNALDMARLAVAKQKPYELLILDWKMPDLDGIEVSSVINQSSLYNMPKVLLVSAYDIDQVRELGQPVGIKHYLEKPFNTSDLIDTIVHAYRNDASKTSSNREQYQLPDLTGKRFLLVEDNQLNVKVARGFLKDTGVVIDEAENGQIALDMLSARTHYDLVLMDVQMPVMDGLTATMKIRNELRLDLPIVAMTAQAMEGDKDRSFSAGMNAYISKPVDSAQLYSTLTDLLEVGASKNSASPPSQPIEPEVVPDNGEHLVMLDEQRAIKALNGDRDLYQGLVSDFIGMESRLAPVIQWANQNQAKDVFQVLHSFKSALSYVGAYNLSEFTAVLEKRIYHANDVTDQDITDLEQFLECTRYLINSVK